MPTSHQQVNAISEELTRILKERLPGYESELVESIGKQYFYGSLSRMVSLSSHLREHGSGSVDLHRSNMKFKLLFPPEVPPQVVEVIKQQAVLILGEFLAA